MKQKITILIRYHKGRELLFQKAIDSIFNSGYDMDLVKIIVHVDNELDYIMLHDKYYEGYENIYIYIMKFYQKVKPCFYNLYCNTLKSLVGDDSWFFYLDSDDTIIEGSLNLISEHLQDEDVAVICQFKRGERLKPSNEMMDKEEVISGKIGMPCIFLHGKHKHIAEFNDDCNADYLFIKEVHSKMATKFIKVAVVQSEKRRFGN